MLIDQRAISRRLVKLQYTCNDRFSAYLSRARRSDDIFPAESDDISYALSCFDEEVERLSLFRPVNRAGIGVNGANATIYPKTHYVTPRESVFWWRRWKR